MQRLRPSVALDPIVWIQRVTLYLTIGEFRMNRITFLASLAWGGAAVIAWGGSVPISLTCNVEQGCNFKAYNHLKFGYINTLTLNNNAISPDLLINEPDAPPAGGIVNPGLFREPVVAVLSSVDWSTGPTNNITLHARISSANVTKLQTLLPSLKNIVVAISFVVYDFDEETKVFYPTFSSYAGSNPNGSPAPPKAPSPVYSPNTIYSGLATVSFSNPAVTDGVPTYELLLRLAPVRAPAVQQLLFQNSSTSKAIAPWGIL